jgi:enolase
MAICRAGAAAQEKKLYQHIAHLANNKRLTLPIPSFNVLEGGVHAGNALPFQEFMIMPIGAKNFSQALQMGAEIYHMLKNTIQKKYGIDAYLVKAETSLEEVVKIVGTMLGTQTSSGQAA